MNKVRARLGEKIRVHCEDVTTGQKVETDIATGYGGFGKNMSPTELMAISLGACILVMMGMKAKELGVDLTGATAEVEKKLASDPHLRISSLDVQIQLPTSPDEGVRAQLEEAGRHCPIHRSLSPDVKQTLTFHWGSG